MRRIVVLVTVVAVFIALLALSAGVALADNKYKDKKNLVDICRYTGVYHGPPYEGLPVIKQIQVKKNEVPEHLAHGDFLSQPGPGFECQFGG